MWFCWLHRRPCRSFGRHHAWQFKEAGRSSMQYHKRNEELLSFGSDPLPPPGTDSKAKLQLYVKVNFHHTRGCNLYIYSLCGVTDFLYCSKWGGQVARKDSKSWTKMNDLSGNMRGAITEISTNQPGAPLLHYYGIREPRA